MRNHFRNSKTSPRLGKGSAPVTLKYMRGALLLEVMISALLLTIGMLGIATGQLAGIQSARSAYLHVQAEGLVNDMVDRVTANASELGSYAGTLVEFESITLPDCAGEAVGCDSEDRVKVDLVEWVALFNMASLDNQDVELLADADAGIERNGNVVRIWVEWHQEAMRSVEQVESDCGEEIADNKQRVCRVIEL